MNIKTGTLPSEAIDFTDIKSFHKEKYSINKKLAQIVGGDEIILYYELKEMEKYYFGTYKDGYFKCDVKSLHDRIFKTPYKQKLLINRLKNFGLIDVKFIGMPKSRHIKILEYIE